jgi:predicted RNase H-like HicB family nuclease
VTYLVIIEGVPGNYSAYVPDLPGCITVGETISEIQQNIKEAITLYAEESNSRGHAMPESTTQAMVISAA